jgi:two-component system chemotaxis sensor kinase CheA
LIIIVLSFSLQVLRRANINLEEQIAVRTRAIQNLLDFSGVGYITFGPDLIVNPEISRECESIFGRSIVGENIAQILFSTNQRQEDFSNAMELVFSGTSQPEVVFDVLDSKIIIDKKTIEMSYRLVDESTIMGQLRDISENEELQRTLEAENTKREMVLKAVTSKRYFLSILEEAEDLFAALESCIVDGNYRADEKKNNQMFRDVHTFKANASFLRMSQTAKLAHTLEEVLLAIGILSDEEPLGDEISELKEVFNNEVSQVVDILGREWLEGADKTEIGLELLERTRKFVRDRYPEDELLLHAIDVLSYLPLSSLFRRLGDMSRDLAATNGKKVRVQIEDNKIAVTPEQYQHLSNAINHILRNTITHGIEFPRHRQKAGKNPEGNIYICSTLEREDIQIRISDDGAGLSKDKITERAIKTGRLKEGESLENKDIVKIIFESGFSTADTVTAVAGRGFGLAAVKESIYQIGGKIRVSTARGRGTTFIIVIPNERKDY